MKDSIPDAWPAQDREGLPSAPLFPLPGIFLFPRQVMQLHIFEQRYREMIRDSLDGPGRIVMGAQLEPEREGAPAPRVLPVGGLGEIANFEKLPDGRFLILLHGLGRVEIEELHGEESYRRVTYTPLDEVPCNPDEAQRFDQELRDAILARVESLLNLPEDLPMDLLVDILLQHLELPEGKMEELYAERRTAVRARIALQYASPAS